MIAARFANEEEVRIDREEVQLAELVLELG
jgi:hypothetical protein